MYKEMNPQQKISLIKFVKAVEKAYRTGVLLNGKYDGISFETKVRKIDNKNYLDFVATTHKYGITGFISTYGIHKGTDGIRFITDKDYIDSDINERIIIRKQGLGFTNKEVADLQLLGYNPGPGFMNGVMQMNILRGSFSDHIIIDYGE
jgi:hypothetical protein